MNCGAEMQLLSVSGYLWGERNSLLQHGWACYFGALCLKCLEIFHERKLRSRAVTSHCQEDSHRPFMPSNSVSWFEKNLIFFNIKKIYHGQVWSLTPVIPALRRTRQEDCKLESRLGCQVRQSYEEEKSIESSLPGFSNANGK